MATVAKKRKFRSEPMTRAAFKGTITRRSKLPLLEADPLDFNVPITRQLTPKKLIFLPIGLSLSSNKSVLISLVIIATRAPLCISLEEKFLPSLRSYPSMDKKYSSVPRIITLGLETLEPRLTSARPESTLLKLTIPDFSNLFLNF